MTAASILAMQAAAEVSVFNGGPDTWAYETGHALELGS